MRTLDRYILKGFLTFFLAGIAVIAVIFMVVSVLDTLSYYFVGKKAALSQIALLYLYEEPGIIYMAMPLAVLISFCIVLGVMEQRRELVAIRAAGVSLFRLSMPLLLASVIISAFMYYLGNNLVPLANRKALETKSIMKGENFARAYGGEFIWNVREEKAGGLRIYRIVGMEKGPERDRVKGFRIYDFDPELELKQEMHAEYGDYESGRWTFYNVHQWEYEGERELSYRRLDELELDLDEEPEDLAVIRHSPEELTSKSLRHYLKDIQRYGIDQKGFWVELRVRQALPFAAIIMALIAVPFGFRPSRTSSLTRNLLFAVIIGFAYFAVMGESISLAKNGTFPPAFGAWIANIIFAIIGFLFFSGTRQ